MKSLLTGIFTTLALLCGLAMAQDATPAPATGTAPQAQPNPAPPQPASSSLAQTGSTPRIAPGSVIPVQLTKSIDAKKAKTGDEIEARVTQDMKAGNGEVLVPKDTRIVGRVTEAQTRNKDQKESQIAIAFDHAVMKAGGDVALPMSIQAIISPSYFSSGNNNGSSQSADQSSPPASAAGGMSPSTSAGRSGGMQSQTPQATASNAPSGEQNANNTRQPITGNTQGVLGISNMTLSTNPGTAQGSVVSSEKNNVKLDSGTLMLLRVNQ